MVIEKSHDTEKSLRDPHFAEHCSSLKNKKILIIEFLNPNLIKVHNK